MPNSRPQRWLTPDRGLQRWIVQTAGFAIVATAIVAWWVTSRETLDFIFAGLTLVIGGEFKRGLSGGGHQ